MPTSARAIEHALACGRVSGLVYDMLRNWTLLLLLIGASGAAQAEGRRPWDNLRPGVLASCPDGGILLPGTSTCARFGGRIRAEVTTGSAAFRSALSRHADARPRSALQAEGRLSVDLRTPTELGTVRTYVEIRRPVGVGSAGREVSPRLDRFFVQTP